MPVSGTWSHSGSHFSNIENGAAESKAAEEEEKEARRSKKKEAKTRREQRMRRGDFGNALLLPARGVACT